MNKRFRSLFSIAAFCCCAAIAQEKPQPLLQVKIQSFDALTANAKRIAAAVGAGADWNPHSEFSKGLGSPDLAGVDRGRTWQLALSLRNPGAAPLIVLYVPVTNFEAFKGGLQDSSPLKGMGKPNEIFKSGEFAVVVFRVGEGGEMAAEEKQKVTAWAPVTAKSLLELALQPDDAARQQALQAIGMGRMIVGQAVAGQTAPAGAPINPQALSQVIGLYFDAFEVFLKGVQRLEFQADLQGDTIAFAKAIHALPDSELARWFKATGGVGDLANQIDPKAAASIAFSIGESPAFLPQFKKLVRLSFQVQNQPVDEKLASQIDKMMDTLTPMKFAGSMDFEKTMSVWGVYEFPGKNIKETYASFKQFFTNSMPSMTGKDKPYSSSEFKEGVRTIGGVPVDRFSMTMNLDSPMFKMPGQKEAIERFWSGGKMEFDYAVKGNRLYLANPDRMGRLLEATPAPQAATGFGVTGNTAVFGRANLLVLIKQMMAINPMIPAEVREKAGRLNTEGGDIRFRIDLDGRFSGKGEIPFKILEAFRQLHGEK